MSSQPTYRLADSTVVEPLVNRWAAWSHTVSPLPFSLHMTHYQQPTLQSYLRKPEVHVQSCQNPHLLGGPFVDIPSPRVSEVRALLNEMEQELQDNMELADSFHTFHTHLVAVAKGQSLEPYYGEIPDSLRGYVELLYDYYHRPIVRCLEGLLYESRYYKKGLQSLQIFTQTSDQGRAFFMSTPRLQAQDQLDWAIPFDDPRIDDLCRIDEMPQPLGAIRELLGLHQDDEHRLRSLVTDESRPSGQAWDGPGIRIRYMGHACTLIEWRGVSILTDPCLGVCPTEGGIARFSYADLPPHIDYVLITHGHHDHFVIETLLRLRHKIGCVVVPKTSGLYSGDLSLKLLAQKIGFRQVQEVETLDRIPLPEGEIVAVPFLGEHADLPHGKTAYVVRHQDEQILFAADSNGLDPRMYEHLRRILGPIQTVFLGMECVGAPLTWVYGPFMPRSIEHSHNQTRRSNACNAQAAMHLIKAVGGTRLYIYAMGREPWLRHLMALPASEQSPQIQEADTVLKYLRDQGCIEAERPYGRMDIHLSVSE